MSLLIIDSLVHSRRAFGVTYGPAAERVTVGSQPTAQRFGVIEARAAFGITYYRPYVWTKPVVSVAITVLGGGGGGGSGRA